LVRFNKGAPGIDGVSFEAIEADGKDQLLQTLIEELKTRTYRTQVVRRVWIPKPDGSKRPLGIPTIRDRVVQMAVKLVIEPIFEADFCETSYGFRPKRSAHDAADAVANGLLTCHHQVIDADISKYFDTIPHDKLMIVVAERVSDGGILWLIKQWLKAAIVEEDNEGKRKTGGGGRGNRRGTPQGGVISPLLSNIYLHLLDRIWERHQLSQKYGARIVRYADDLVILCSSDINQPLKMLKKILDRLGLQLNDSKTRVLNARSEHFDFLGFSFRVFKGQKTGKLYPHVEPSKQSIQRIKDRLKRLTNRKRTATPVSDMMEQVNGSLRGWSSYFHYRNCTQVFSHLKWQTEERLRVHLRRRFKISTRAKAYCIIPNSKLYQEYGLFKLPTTAAWR
jgi:group II intron reverse transcriptase/maturase